MVVYNACVSETVTGVGSWYNELSTDEERNQNGNALYLETNDYVYPLVL